MSAAEGIRCLHDPTVSLSNAYLKRVENKRMTLGIKPIFVPPAILALMNTLREVHVKMFSTKQKNLAEVCPQCCKLINSSANRLVHDSCGHLKCRICLLQEITGCLLCGAEKKSSEKNDTRPTDLTQEKTPEPQQRKSVITSLAIQIAEQKQKEESKSSSVDKDTCHLIKQSLEKDILFPTDIVKRSTGNFYHLKRIFSQRFFNEDNNKKHKACETEENWSSKEKEDKSEDENVVEKSWKMPSHVQVQYYCEVHKKIFKDKTEIMKEHMTCNSEEKQIELYKCKVCSKNYKEMGKLNRHMKLHTKESKFKCGYCGKSCADNYAKRAHERTHTQQKPYTCQSCGAKFSGLQNYKRHNFKHKNEKNFVCDECGFKFLTKTELKRHVFTHRNVKPFSCSVCSRKFAFKRTLERHSVTHNPNLSKLKCSVCESTFRRKDNLERHMRSAHVDIKKEQVEDDYSNRF